MSIVYSDWAGFLSLLINSSSIDGKCLSFHSTGVTLIADLLKPISVRTVLSWFLDTISVESFNWFPNLLYAHPGWTTKENSFANFSLFTLDKLLLLEESLDEEADASF